MRARRVEQVVPSAARLLGSLRDLGYDFVNAVADVVDNSVSAKASEVHIVIHSGGPESWIRIADNGVGMNGATITEAMRLGTGQRDYSSEELGKFGLGLKTASLSQARSITVASRTNLGRAVIECRRLDLDAIQASDRWEIEIPAAAQRPHEVTEPLKNSTGTVVMWEKLDRVLDLKDPFGGWSHRYLLKLAERLDRHLGMVFGRFISGEAKRKGRLTLTVNGTKVEQWDPFCLDERTEQLPVHDLRVGGGLVRYRPYVLPPQHDFSSDEAWRLASGPNQWNRQQGLYIYRADRMIQSGGWSWLRGADEHIKLARAAVEFWPGLDETFEINVAKTRVKLPEELRDQLKPLVAMLTRRADDRYRKSKPRRDRATPSHSRPAKPRSDHPESGQPQPPREQPAGTTAQRPTSAPPPGGPAPAGVAPVPGHDPQMNPHAAGKALEETAKRLGFESAIRTIREELRNRHPEIARDIGW